MYTLMPRWFKPTCLCVTWKKCTHGSLSFVLLWFCSHLFVDSCDVFILRGLFADIGPIVWLSPMSVNILRPRRNGRLVPDDIFKCIFLNENGCIWIKISLKFVPKGPINSIPALAQIVAWRRPGGKTSSALMMVYWRIYVSLGLNELTKHDKAQLCDTWDFMTWKRFPHCWPFVMWFLSQRIDNDALKRCVPANNKENIQTNNKEK